MIPLLTTTTGIQFVQGLSPVAWYRYGVGLTNDGGGLCSLWADQSGNGRNLTAATTARPTIQADNSLLFDGTGNIMATAGFTLNQPETVYLLAKAITWTSTDHLWDGAAANSGAGVQVGVSPQISLNATNTVCGNNSLALGTYGAMAAVFNGASSIFTINTTDSATGDVGASNMSGFTLGDRGGGGTPSNIQVKEAIVFAAAHDAATRKRILSYLGAVGGLGL